MCGIAGYSGSFRPTVLALMSRAIRQRGPDGEGEFVDGDVGLVHTRLAILDLSPTGAQPLEDNDGRVVISFNGEIYNFRELRRELEATGVVFRGRSDTEVLANLYVREGSEMLSRLNGIFALAIWDRAKRELFLARDGLGVKPLYVFESARGFAFASEIKALLPVLEGNTQLDPISIHRYLSFLWCPGEGTPFRAVRKLGPGEALVVREGRVTRRWTWSRLPAFERQEMLSSVDEATDGITDRLRAAVTRQMVADVPVGAFLSGGLDSSAIVAFAREHSPDIRCFTIDVEGGQEAGTVDDLPFARRAAAHLNVKLEVVHVESSAMAADLPAMVQALDEPLADAAPLNVLYISQLARQHGIKVLLSGAGGDDVFSGYRRHLAVMAAQLWDWLPAPLRRAAAEATPHLDQRNPLRRRIAKALTGAALDGDARIASWFQWIAEPELFKLYTPDFRASIGGGRAVAPFIEFLSKLDRRVHPLDRMLAVEQRFFLGDHNLVYTDKMSMAAGVETRVPFLDPDLMAFAARIPPRYKQHGTVGKWILKRTMEKHLPHDVIYRSKTGFGAPLRRWLRKDLLEVVRDVLSARSLRERGLFAPTAVAQLIERDATGQIDATYVIFALMCIELWCRAFVDRAPQHLAPAA